MESEGQDNMNQGQNMDDLIKAAEAAIESSSPETSLRESEVRPAEILSEIETLKTELEEEKERVLRVAAEFDNYKKRTSRDLDRERTARVEALIRRLIPVLDNLDRALSAKVSDAASLRSGLELTLQSFRGILGAEGVERIKALGAPFNPNLHEALAVLPQEGAEEGTILEEFEAGYTLGSVLLKPSRVRVAGKPDKQKEEGVNGRGGEREK